MPNRSVAITFYKIFTPHFIDTLSLLLWLVESGWKSDEADEEVCGVETHQLQHQIIKYDQIVVGNLIVYCQEESAHYVLFSFSDSGIAIRV